MSSNTVWLYVDDANPEVTYTGNWETLNVGLGAFNQTMTCTNTTDSTAKLDVTGGISAAMAVLGLVELTDPKSPPISSYSIDESTPVTYTGEKDKNGTVAVMFYSPKLSSSNHSIVVTAKRPTPFFCIDAFAFQVDSADIPNDANPSQLVTTALAAPTGTASSNNTVSGAASNHTVPVGPIVGGTIGGVALLVITAFLFYFCFWRRRGKEAKPYYYSEASKGEMLEQELEGKVTPFTSGVGPSGPQPSAGSAAPLVSPPPSAYGSSQTSYPPTPYAPSSIHSPPVSETHDSVVLFPAEHSHSGSSSYGGTQLSGGAQSVSAYSVANSRSNDDTSPGHQPNFAGMTPGQRKAAEAALRRNSPSSLQQHTDSGVRFGNAAGSSQLHAVPEDVPPVYSES